MKSFSGITKGLTSAAMDGVLLYGTKKGVQVASTLARKVVPALDPKISGLLVAGLVTVVADMTLPSKYSRLAGAVAMSEVLSSFVSPTLDPMLVKAGVLDSINVPVPVAALPGATSGYAQRMGSYAGDRGMAGYASVRGMGGYTSAMGNQGQIFPTTNAVGLPG